MYNKELSRICDSFFVLLFVRISGEGYLAGLSLSEMVGKSICCVEPLIYLEGYWMGYVSGEQYIKEAPNYRALPLLVISSSSG